jgi:hypothetical protein
LRVVDEWGIPQLRAILRIMLRNRLEVVFHLPGQVTEIRYLDQLPEVGEMVELRGHPWRVAHVERKRNWAGYEVLCERPRTGGCAIWPTTFYERFVGRAWSAGETRSDERWRGEIYVPDEVLPLEVTS